MEVLVCSAWAVAGRGGSAPRDSPPAPPSPQAPSRPVTLAHDGLRGKWKETAPCALPRPRPSLSPRPSSLKPMTTLRGQCSTSGALPLHLEALLPPRRGASSRPQLPAGDAVRALGLQGGSHGSGAKAPICSSLIFSSTKGPPRAPHVP